MRNQLSQQKLLEVLTYEIEVLRKATKDIHTVAPVIAGQLKQLKETKIVADVDTHKLEYLISPS